jgi:eukaryotic-like serine/threonine-protein kinase
VASIAESFGNARVVEQIATGPLTDVYHCVQEPLGRHVAIKALRSTIAPSSPFSAHLAREAELLAELRHANILELYDFVRTDTAMWLVLEYVEGASMSDILAKAGKIDVWAAVAIGIEVGRAMAHAHERGIIHRDVKPGNIIVSKSGGVKLVDFGIAHDDRVPSSPEPLVEGGSTFGTPAYMSPEQILGENVDARTDIFSLGIVLYQLIAGVRPFDAPDTPGTAQRIRHSNPGPITRSTPDVPGVVERIILRCLEKEPGDRFATANELVSALGSALRAEKSESTEEIIVAELTRTRIVEQAVTPRQTSQIGFVSEPARGSLWPALRGYLALFLLVLVGGAAIRYRVRTSEEATATKAGPLELAPASLGFLRVVANPWAEVIVDGQRLDTTPIARPLPLSAGTHYVTLKHPKVKEQRRVVKVVQGQTVLLDVNMGIVPEPQDAGPDRWVGGRPGEEDAGTATP